MEKIDGVIRYGLMQEMQIYTVIKIMYSNEVMYLNFFFINYEHVLLIQYVIPASQINTLN